MNTRLWTNSRQRDVTNFQPAALQGADTRLLILEGPFATHVDSVGKGCNHALELQRQESHVDLETPPVFVMGFPRSGTTAVASAICANERFYGADTEGHYFYMLAPALERFLSGTMHSTSLVNQTVVTGTIGVHMRTFLKSAIGSFYGDQPGRRYVDKTPGIEQVESLPTLLKLYPTAPVIFCFREPVGCIESNIRTWPKDLTDPEAVALEWVRTMRRWRRLRKLLDRRRFAEIYQADDALRTTRLLMRPLGLSPTESATTRQFLSSQIVNTPNPARRPSSVLNAAQRRQISRIAAWEWHHWKPWTRALHPNWWISRKLPAGVVEANTGRPQVIPEGQP